MIKSSSPGKKKKLLIEKLPKNEGFLPKTEMYTLF